VISFVFELLLAVLALGFVIGPTNPIMHSTSLCRPSGGGVKNSRSRPILGLGNVRGRYLPEVGRFVFSPFNHLLPKSEVKGKRLGGLARREARRCGLLARRHHAAGFMLVEPYTGRVVHGDGYTLSALRVLQYCKEQRRKQGAQAQRLLEPHSRISNIGFAADSRHAATRLHVASPSPSRR
jgi:hypothetical protein